MPVVLEERWGRSLDDMTYVRNYLVRNDGSADVFTIRDQIELDLPYWYDNKQRQEPQVDELEGGDLFYATVFWKARSLTPLEVNQEEFWFDTGGGTQTITQSLAAQVNYVAPAPGAVAIDYRGAIRVTDNGPQGVEVPRPNLTLGVTRIFPKADVTPGFIGMLTRMTGSVNTAAFRGFEAGECMLTNVNGRDRNAEETAISFRFAGRANDTIDIGDISNIDVDGWDHVDVYYDQKPEDGFIIHVPRQVVVSKIARRRDFGLLGVNV
jgi:hypothetical protein